jgi:predicted nuclease of predicted toxin-antitoxin system
MQFFVDENVRKEVTGFLRAEGHDVLTATPGSEDAVIARRAKETKSIILTHDHHFADILMYPPEEYSGIIRIKIHPPSAPVIIKALTNLLKDPASKQLQGKLVILEEDGFRIR